MIISAIILGIAGTWITTQRMVISKLERETTGLEKRIAESQSLPDLPRAASKASVDGKESAPRFTFDWSKLLSQVVQWQKGVGDYRERAQFYECIAAMSSAEILGKLEEISALDMPEGERNFLAAQFLNILGKKDPEKALDWYWERRSPRFENLNSLANILGGWSKNDPTKACEWLDRKIAKGEFETKSLDGVSKARVSFEENLARLLYDTQPELIKSRLQAMYEDEARRVAHNLAYMESAQKDPAALAILLRESLTQHHSTEILASLASHRSEKLDEAARFINAAQATPAERNACAEQILRERIRDLGDKGSLKIEDLDALRQWTGDVGADVDATTAIALGYSVCSGRFDFEEVSGVVLHYCESSGNQRILLEFLASNARFSVREARELAGKVADPQQRQMILDRIR